MLKITTKIDNGETFIELEGRLTGPWVDELRYCWGHASEAGHGIQVVLKQVMFIDDDGKQLLEKMYRAGAVLTAEGCMTRAIVEEISEGKIHE
jgi:hypothetical protein